MDKTYLVVNPGSTSKKYALYQGERFRFAASLEKKGEGLAATASLNAKRGKVSLSPADFTDSLAYFLRLARSKKLLENRQTIAGAGVRVVAPGSDFAADAPVTPAYLAGLRRARVWAPLHLEPLLAEIEALDSLLPGVPVVGVSDSAFHASIPEAARRYGIAARDAERLGIFRFGYHGISVRSVMRKTPALLGRLPARIVVCHLGGGASLTAVKNGRSLDTSMGFTPLEGLLMGTRSGDIGAGALLYLARENKWEWDELEEYLNTKSGLLGLSGKSGDIRELLALEADGDDKARLALEVYVYRVKKYIGAYAAALNGLDLLIFTAAVGERSPRMRARICADLDYLGVKLDPARNEQTVDKDGLIQEEGAPVTIAVIRTDEMGEIVRRTRELLVASFL
jgi:acetate kinase